MAAIDLGTSRIRAWHPKRGALLDEPSLVALDEFQGRACAVGTTAKNMIGRTPEGVTVRRAVEAGRVTDFEAARMLVRHALDHARSSRWARRPVVVTSAPVDCSTMQVRALEQALVQVGAARAVVVPSPVAAALSGVLPFADGAEGMLVDVGAGTCELAVFARGRMVDAATLPLGGDLLDQAVTGWVRREHQVALGPVAAEQVRIAADCADGASSAELLTRGRHVGDGTNQAVHVHPDEVHEVCRPLLTDVADAVRTVLSRCPDELLARITEDGLVLTGGLANGRWLRDCLQTALGVPVRVADAPDTRTAAGLGLLARDPDRAHAFAPSSWQRPAPATERAQG
ncbi:rod shape-determining protein [Streptacidiphilus fuscans]|uniref:Rod shape-determining protein n=1 Tax=Streptacidiphilus fuscans TaxID=2789292 RepID=A0A931BFY6_9ACTN|nr:rod shape-determining protein [Streptacidiphilus fuscans]MBF9072750.1 rod shape-determining protein [Streptacidiphilus fuscans]